LEAVQLSDRVKVELLKDVPFMDASVFESKLFTEQYDFVFLSMLPDCHEGVYRHKQSGHRITFSSANYDLTNPAHWPHFMNGEYTNHNFKFTQEVLAEFAAKFTFEGFMEANEIVEHIRFIRNQVLPAKTHLILVLGSEVECEAQTTQEFAHHANHHHEVNQLLKVSFEPKDNVGFINVTDLIKTQHDFRGCTNHFTRQVYYQLANEISNSVNACLSDGKMEVDSKLKFYLHSAVWRVKLILSRIKLVTIGNQRFLNDT
jgi:hypothetical protein